MRAIIVDDEIEALENLGMKLSKYQEISEIKTFSDPERALLYAKSERVDLAFLDIELPGMNGIACAKRLKDCHSQTNIVFVTGHSSYALDAFAVWASAYLLKPVSMEAITNALKNLRNPIAPSVGGRRIRVQTFGSFEIFVDNKPLSFSRSKSKELLAFLVSKQGALCNNHEIISVIWEDRPDANPLQSQFRHLVSDLMQTLRSVNAEEILVKQRGRLGVAPASFDCDFYDFLRSDPRAINRYMGEYMSQYSWAEFINAYLDQ